MVVVSVLAHGRAIPLLWQTLDHPSASLSASVSIALLEKADQLLSGFGAITLLADRAFPCDELIAWFGGKPRWSYVIRLRGDTEIHRTTTPLGYQVRKLHLRRGQCRGFRGDRPSNRLAGGGTLVSDQQPCCRSRSGLELREALLL